MVQAAFRDSSKSEAELRRLLDQSDKMLAPIGDPLRAGLGLNRWLRDDREEAYSDWFAWILEHLDAKDLVEMFHVRGDDVVSFCREKPFRVQREQIIPEGRLDIVVSFGEDALARPASSNQAILVIEVKITSAEQAATEKQRIYRDWLARNSCLYKPRPVLVAVDAEYDDYEGFTPVTWADVCVMLRRMLPDLCRRLGVLKTAMIAAFVGAVESNLLHLGAPAGSRGGLSLFCVPTIAHLKASMG